MIDDTHIESAIGFVLISLSELHIWEMSFKRYLGMLIPLCSMRD